MKNLIKLMRQMLLSAIVIMLLTDHSGAQSVTDRSAQAQKSWGDFAKEKGVDLVATVAGGIALIVLPLITLRLIVKYPEALKEHTVTLVALSVITPAITVIIVTNLVDDAIIGTMFGASVGYVAPRRATKNLPEADLPSREATRST